MKRSSLSETNDKRTKRDEAFSGEGLFFDHEKLVVYQRSLDFVSSSQHLMRVLPGDCRVKDQLERAADSIPLNIAKGNGRSTPKDLCKFFDIAKGSAFACAAALDTCVSRGLLQKVDTMEAKQQLRQIVGLLVGLIRNTDPDRVVDSSASYLVQAQRPLGALSI
ncbi:MAG: four helix bundle protein [Planctomycetota bacterium]